MGGLIDFLTTLNRVLTIGVMVALAFAVLSTIGLMEVRKEVGRPITKELWFILFILTGLLALKAHQVMSW